MASTMKCPPDKSLATRTSLLHRLKDCDDQTSWQKFYELYRDLIYRFALKAGLTETEAEEAVQETVIAVARNLADFKYDPAVCSFKTWLLNQTSWRIKDQLRKRGKAAQTAGLSQSGATPDLRQACVELRSSPNDHGQRLRRVLSRELS